MSLFPDWVPPPGRGADVELAAADRRAAERRCQARIKADANEAALREWGFADANQRDFWTRVGDQALPFLCFVAGYKIQLSEWEWLWDAYCSAQDAQDEADTVQDARR